MQALELLYVNTVQIRENITPRGDGNTIYFLLILSIALIRENITPRGDGN